jgi:hypothetical protein
LWLVVRTLCGFFCGRSPSFLLNVFPSFYRVSVLAYWLFILTFISKILIILIIIMYIKFFACAIAYNHMNVYFNVVQGNNLPHDINKKKIVNIKDTLKNINSQHCHHPFQNEANFRSVMDIKNYNPSVQRASQTFWLIFYYLSWNSVTAYFNFCILKTPWL